MSKHHKNYDKTANEIAEIAGGLQSGENTVKETEVFAEEFTEGFDLEAMEEIEEAVLKSLGIVIPEEMESP